MTDTEGHVIYEQKLCILADMIVSVSVFFTLCNSIIWTLSYFHNPFSLCLCLCLCPCLCLYEVLRHVGNPTVVSVLSVFRKAVHPS